MFFFPQCPSFFFSYPSILRRDSIKLNLSVYIIFFFFQAEDGIRDHCVTGVQTCALPISLEVMSRFAANPKWLIYLPPTMSPSETTREPGLLEHPAEAFAYYRHEGVPKVICEQKHMGSCAVVIVCRNEEAARKRFGVVGDGAGICYTRTGGRFFEDRQLEAELLANVRAALEQAGFWVEFKTDWVCLDCELMP